MNNQDQMIYQKAQRRVIFHLVFSLFLLILYFIGVYFVLNIDFLKISGSSLNNVIIALGAAQICLFGLLFLLLSFGKKIFRIFYWFGFLLTLGLFYVPIKYALDDMANILTYATLAGFMFIKTMFLIQLGSYLKRNKWARIFFDWTIDVYEEEEETYVPPVQTKKRPISQPKQKRPQYVQESTYIEEEYEEESQEKEPYTQPQISIRLGICVYASLMIFPIIVQIFSNFFSSYDLQSVFATKDMFMLCIFSALVWTIPVFYLYYDHPYAKRIVLICILLEALCILFYLPKFIGYYTAEDPKYPLRVFILFVIVDAIRYGVLLFSLKPLTQVTTTLKDEEL